MKKKHELIKSIPEIAEKFAIQFICGYGIERAELVAKLVLEKIRANKKRLEQKYGKEN